LMVNLMVTPELLVPCEAMMGERHV
jgi:hypothetical protein